MKKKEHAKLRSFFIFFIDFVFIDWLIDWLIQEDEIGHDNNDAPPGEYNQENTRIKGRQPNATLAD